MEYFIAVVMLVLVVGYVYWKLASTNGQFPNAENPKNSDEN
jgi:hypothetical protein